MYTRGKGKVWWTSIKGERRSLETKNKKAAENFERKLKTLQLEGKFLDKLPGEGKYVSEMLDRFIEEHGPKVSEGTFKSYLTSVKPIKRFFKTFKLTEIRPRDVVAFKKHRLATGIKPASVNREVSCLSKAYNLAMKEWEWVRDNPCSKVSREKENNQRIRWLYTDEEERLISACHDDIKDIVIFAIETGMRLGELLALRWTDVSIVRETATVMKSKNHQPRTIPLEKRPVEVLKRIASSKKVVVGFVFPSSTGTKLDGNNLRKEFSKALKAAGIEDFRFHDLRHTYGTRLAQAGVELFTISRLMGHKDVKTTMRYLHHSTETLRANVERAKFASGSVTFIHNPSTVGAN
jgi:integrase